MARDPDSLTIEKWATTGDVRTPEDRGLNEAVGWPADFSQVGGRRPTREVFNWMFRVLTAMAVELNSHGLLEWSNQINYRHPAAVLASDGMVYLSKLASGPNQGGAIDPTGSQGSTGWRPVADPVPDASTSVKGRVELATADEAVAGEDTERAVTPAGLAARTPNASTTVKGRVELATADEAVAGTDTQRAVTPRGLQAAGDDRYLRSVAHASTSQRGTVELATPVEAKAGTDTQRAVTPAGLAARTPNASTTVKGRVELATNTETQTGTDTTRAVTPAGVAAAVGGLRLNHYAATGNITNMTTFFNVLAALAPNVGDLGFVIAQAFAMNGGGGNLNSNSVYGGVFERTSTTQIRNYFGSRTTNSTYLRFNSDGTTSYYRYGALQAGKTVNTVQVFRAIGTAVAQSS